MHRAACMQFSTNLQLFQVIQCIYPSMHIDSPTNLDMAWPCHKCFCRGGGWGWWGAAEWWVFWFQKLDATKWPQLRYPYALIITRCAKSTANITNKLCGDFQPAMGDCLSSHTRAISRPPKHLWTLDSLEKEAWVKADCFTLGSSMHMYC